MPRNQDNTLDLTIIIERFKNIHEVVNKTFSDLNTPRALFTSFYKLDPIELAGGEGTSTKTLPDDGETLSLLT